MYRSDLNYLRGAAWIATGALQIEGSKRATDLISDVGHRLFFRFFIPFFEFSVNAMLKLAVADIWKPCLCS